MQIKCSKNKGQLIALTGYAQSGKDTCADILCEEYGYVKVAWADRVREMALRLNPSIRTSWLGSTSLQQMVEDQGWDKAKENQQVRKLLQNLGSSVRDLIGPRAWVDALLPEIKKHIQAGRHCVVSDTRYENEAAAVLDLGGSVVLVHRDGVGPVNDHESDAGLAFPMAVSTIFNDGPVEPLREKCRILHNSLIDSKGPGEADETMLDADTMICHYAQTVDRCMAHAAEMLIKVAAPGSVALEDWLSRHSVVVHTNLDSVDVEVDGEEAGNAVYCDGVITIDAYVSR